MCLYKTYQNYSIPVSYPVPNRFTLRSGPVWNCVVLGWYRSRVNATQFRRTEPESKWNRAALISCKHNSNEYSPRRIGVALVCLQCVSSVSLVRQLTELSYLTFDNDFTIVKLILKGQFDADFALRRLVLKKNPTKVASIWIFHSHSVVISLTDCSTFSYNLAIFHFL